MTASAPFVPAWQAVAGEAPQRWLLVLHGIFGSGANWRSVARKLVERCPDWGCALVDLRMHGDSQAAPAPHSVAAAAADLDALIDALAGEDKRVAGVCGHSFGGKVALALASRREGRGLERTIVLDSDPAAHPEQLTADPPPSTVGVLTALESLPRDYESRAQFVGRVVDLGYPKPLAQWLGMNVVPANGGYRQRLEPAAVRALLESYYRLDLLEVAASAPGSGRALHVWAGASSAVSTESQQRLRAAADDNARLRIQTISGAGHWLHVDAPTALLEVLAAELAA